MGTYRDDLAAAVARADALAREIEGLERQGGRDRDRIRRLEILLDAARQELASAPLEPRRPPSTSPPRPTRTTIGAPDAAASLPLVLALLSAALLLAASQWW